MNKGTIYYDESSRGTAYPRPRGRWVGERIDNGKRVRMRSTNYDKVLKWITGDARECNRIELKGLPGYSIDVERKEVFGKRGMLKGIMNSAGQRQYELFPDGKRFAATFNRLAYAALHNIDVRKIPFNIIVRYKDGEYVLIYRDDLPIDVAKERHADNRRKITNTLKKRMLEIEMLQRYYKTGKTEEIVEYATKTCFDKLVSHVRNQRRCTLAHATDIVLEATEMFFQRTLKGSIPVVSISNTIQNLCRKATYSIRKREYDDNSITN